MGKGKPIFYNALLLTAVNLVLRFVSTSFQVYLSGQIGAAGIGLLQLVMSVNSFAVVAGIMVYISFDELLPMAERWGHHHLSIYGVTTGMLIMALVL